MQHCGESASLGTMFNKYLWGCIVSQFNIVDLVIYHSLLKD
jgi:hypothetical protein